VLLVLGVTLWAPFQYDDYSLLSGPSVWRPWQTRPLTYLTFWCNRILNGDNPAGYHVVNMILHMTSAGLLLTALRRALPERAALIAAFLFALHPLQVEAVAYIFARSTLLATLFCLISLNLWLQGRHWLATAAFGLALLSKEECAAFPVALAVLSERPLQRKPLATMLGMAVSAVAWVALATVQTPGSGAGADAGITPLSYFFTQGTVLLRYARQLFLPTGLSVDPLIPLATPTEGIACWVLIGLVAILGLRYNRWLLAGILLILPTSSFFPASDLAADRRMYLPMLSLSAAAGILLARIQLSWAAIALLAVASFNRAQVWTTQQRLWSDAHEKAPSKLRPRIWLLRSSEKPVSNETAQELHKLAPDNPSVANELGRAYMLNGQYQQALEEFARAVALSPRDALSYNNRGAAFLALGLQEPAIESFKQALKLNPSLPEAQENLNKIRVKDLGTNYR